jgi:hypothetical protein
MARPVKSHVFRGKRYKIEFANGSVLRDRDGDCDPPNKAEKKIRLYKGMSGKRALEVALHEPLHAIFWDLEESAIDEIGKDLSDFLWRLGYRKIPDEKTTADSQ